MTSPNQSSQTFRRISVKLTKCRWKKETKGLPFLLLPFINTKLDEKNAEATELKKKVNPLEIKLNERNTELSDLKEIVNTIEEQKIT